MTNSRGVFGMAIMAGVLAAVGGCAGEDPEIAETQQQVVIAPGAFVFHRSVNGLNCANNEVMVGIHVNQQKVICAQLNYGYQIGSVYYDHYNYTNSPGPNTQVSSNPSMHGCAPNYFIQGTGLYAGGEIHKCVSLRTSANEALYYSSTLHDGRGPSDNGTQSLATYGLSPNMHVCPPNYAMAGLHRVQNDLFCGG